jgi:hypothetical protein
MTSTVTGAARPAAEVEIAAGVMLPDPHAVVDADTVRAIVAEAAREITGVATDVRVRARLARGAAVLSMRLPIRYPMPVWQVSTVCRNHVLDRMRDRIGIPVRRLDIEVSELVRP